MVNDKTSFYILFFQCFSDNGILNYQRLLNNLVCTIANLKTNQVRDQGINFLILQNCVNLLYTITVQPNLKTNFLYLRNDQGIAFAAVLRIERKNQQTINKPKELTIKYVKDKTIISNEYWINNFILSKCGRVCFISDNLIITQQDGVGYTNMFRIVDQELKEEKDLQIQLKIPNEKSDYILFPTIYNKNRELIIQKSHQYVYFIRKQENEKIKMEGYIDCKTRENYGALTESGDYLVIWDALTKSFRVYGIEYD